MSLYDIYRNSAQVGLQPGRNASTTPIQSRAVTQPAMPPMGATPGGWSSPASVAPGGTSPNGIQPAADGQMPPQGAFTTGDGTNPVLNAQLAGQPQPPGGSVMGAFQNGPLSKPLMSFANSGSMSNLSVGKKG